MKRSLILSMMTGACLCSLASAATTITSPTLATSVVGWSAFSSSSTGSTSDYGTATKTNVTVTTNSTISNYNCMTIVDTVDCLTAANATSYSSGFDSSAAFVLDLSKVTTSTFQFILGYSLNTSTPFWGLGLSTDLKLQGTWASATAAYSNGSLTTDALSATKVYVVLSHNKDQGSTIQYQLEGSETTVSKNLTGLKSTTASTGLTQVNLSQALVDSGAIDQLYLYNSYQAGSAATIISEMKAIEAAKAVPEPTAATFGLMSLCSMLFIRRRK